MKYFAFREEFKMWSREFEKVFGRSRKKNEPVLKKHKDIAASIQAVTEELLFGILRNLKEETSQSALCIGGGVGLNALANGKITESTPFKETFIYGAAGDSGGAVGAGLFLYHYILGNKKKNARSFLSLGTEYSDSEILETLKKYRGKVIFTLVKKSAIPEKCADVLVQGKIVGWFQGRMEFGPRALGNRSILASPLKKEMKEKVNVVKKREQFRPFAGSVLEDKVSTLFVIPKGKDAKWPFMNYCFKASENGKKMIPAIVHEDGTTRIQTVGRDNELYHDVIGAFYEKTGVPCILNTSFNVKGEPIVENPDQAVEDLINTKMDCLFIGNYFVVKK